MGTPPNTSIVLTPTELEFIATEFGGSPSAAIHAALSNIMNINTDEDEMASRRYAAFETAKSRRGVWAVLYQQELCQYMVKQVSKEEHPNLTTDHYYIDDFPGGNTDLCRIYKNGQPVLGALIHNQIVFVDKV